MIYFVRLSAIVLMSILAMSFFSKPSPEIHSKNLGYRWEQYDPACFNKFQTVQSIINYADSCMGISEKNTMRYYNFIARILKLRFYHGYSRYSAGDNPLAFFAGSHIWKNLSAIVIPDDIMKHPMAACSQQAIVLMEIFRRNNISYRKVAFKNHYAIEGFIENEWRYFDTNMEPVLPPERMPLDTLQAENKFSLAYSNSGFKDDDLKKILSEPKHGTVNERPARRAVAFHRVCLLMSSKWFLLSILLVSAWPVVKEIILRIFFRKAGGPEILN